LRAAEALVALKTDMVAIFEQVVAAKDRYGLHAYLTALENADLRGKLEVELQDNPRITEEEKKRLLSVLQAGTLSAVEPATPEPGPKNLVAPR
jgi:hypothetical protein